MSVTPSPAPGSGEPVDPKQEPGNEGDPTPDPNLVDERGVPWKNVAMENSRKAERERGRAEAEATRALDYERRFQEFMREQSATPATPAVPAPGVPLPPAATTPAQAPLTRQDMETMFQEFQLRGKYEDAMDTAQTTARDRYSDLKNSDSEFTREVDLEYRRQMDWYTTNNLVAPAELYLNVANETALSGKVETTFTGKEAWEETSTNRAVNRAAAPPKAATGPAPKSAEGDFSMVPESVKRRAAQSGIPLANLVALWEKRPSIQDAWRQLKERE